MSHCSTSLLHLVLMMYSFSRKKNFQRKYIKTVKQLFIAENIEQETERNVFHFFKLSMDYFRFKLNEII